MIQIEDISLEDLRTQLAEVEGKVPTQRVETAIGRKLGLSTETLAELHNVSDQTIRNWLNRFKQQPIDQAPYDGSRSGRPAKLSDEEKTEFFAELHKSPEEVGYNRQVWFPLLAYHHLMEAYDVEYSLRHVYRLLHEAGLSWRTARPRHYDADPEEEAEFQETEKKAPPLIEDGWTFLTVDQFTKRVQTVQRRGWYPIGSNPTIEVSGSRKKVTVLKAVTHDGETIHFWTEENLSADHGIRLLRALQAEFGKKLVVFLDQASYFYAKDLWEFVSGKRSTECVDDTSVECVQSETLQVWYFPAHLPELNPVEGC